RSGARSFARVAGDGPHGCAHRRPSRCSTDSTARVRPRSAWRLGRWRLLGRPLLALAGVLVLLILALPLVWSNEDLRSRLCVHATDDDRRRKKKDAYCADPLHTHLLVYRRSQSASSCRTSSEKTQGLICSRAGARIRTAGLLIANSPQ